MRLALRGILEGAGRGHAAKEPITRSSQREGGGCSMAQPSVCRNPGGRVLLLGAGGMGR